MKSVVKMTGKKSKKNIISFDEECDSNKISTEQPTNRTVQANVNDEQSEQNGAVPIKKRKKKKKVIKEETVHSSSNNTDGTCQVGSGDEIVSEVQEDDEQKIKPKESIRERKRKKHAQLVETKKLKVDQDAQQMALNYLSKWKHAREEWKFEKLKQIWLSENLFNSSKLPDDMWSTAIEYFSSSRGFIRKLIMREALKVVDAVGHDSDDKDDSQSLKLNRARDIIQHLKEV